MTNAMITKAKKAIEEVKEMCSFADTAYFRHHGQNYRASRSCESDPWSIYRRSETDIYDTKIGEIKED